jgi:hypothetical protein
MYDVKDGKVSPWVILNAPSGRELLKCLGEEQLSGIINIINPGVWSKKFKTDSVGLRLIKDTVLVGKL